MYVFVFCESAFVSGHDESRDGSSASSGDNVGFKCDGAVDDDGGDGLATGTTVACS